MFRSFAPSLVGADVNFLQLGLLQWYRARFASRVVVALEKSSLLSFFAIYLATRGVYRPGLIGRLDEDVEWAPACQGAAFLGNQHASHPINAMLNYCYIVEAGWLAKALAAQGVCLSIGFLHSDKKGRKSLCVGRDRAVAASDRREGVRLHRSARVNRPGFVGGSEP